MYLADTNFIIDLLRKKYDFSQFKQRFKHDRIAISLISLIELYTGLYYTKVKVGKTQFQTREDELKSVLLSFDILELNQQIVESAGKMRGELLARGITIDTVDLLIGATAQFYQTKSILTRNIDHFSCWKIKIDSYS